MKHSCAGPSDGYGPGWGITDPFEKHLRGLSSLSSGESIRQLVEKEKSPKLAFLLVKFVMEAGISMDPSCAPNR